MANEDPRYGDLSGTLPHAGAGLPRPWGRYVLLHALAQGGMGAIYIAKYGGSAGFERYCVIKTLRRQYTEDADAVARFLDESRVVAQLQHANICSVFDVGQVDGRFYLAMDYVAGFDAHALQRRCLSVGASLPPGLIAYVMGEVLDALDYAHRLLSPTTGTPLGIVHRDISPNNVLISFEGEVKLIDFGIALSSLKNQRTEPTLLIGKVSYMAPEQATGDPVDARADQYAAAVVLYELMTGEDFYTGLANKQAIWSRVALGDFRPPSYSRVDAGLRAILDRALARDRADRFPSCAEMREALDAYAWGLGWRASKAQLRKLMAERFSLEMATQRRLLFSFSDVHVAPTLEVLGLSTDSEPPVPAGRAPRPVTAVMSRLPGAKPQDAALATVPAAVPLGLPGAGPLGAPKAGSLGMPSQGTPSPTAALAPRPPHEPGESLNAKAQPSASVAGQAGLPSVMPFRDVPSSRPALVAAAPRRVTPASFEAPRAATNFDIEPPPSTPPPCTDLAAFAPAIEPLAPVPSTDVVRHRGRAGARRARGRSLLLLVLLVTSAGAAYQARGDLRAWLEPRALWPSWLAGPLPLLVDAGPAAAQVTRPDAGHALLLMAALDVPADAGAASSPSDAGAAASPNVDGDAGIAASDAGDLAPDAATADAGDAALVPPAAPLDGSVADKLAWLKERCRTLSCVEPAATLVARKRSTRAQRQAGTRAVDRCVARCGAQVPASP